MKIEDFDYEAWAKEGERLAKTRHKIYWGTVDWIMSGDDSWPSKDSEGRNLRHEGKSFGPSCAKILQISSTRVEKLLSLGRAYPTSNGRVRGLSIQHHIAVKAVEDVDERLAILKQAKSMGWNSTKLKSEAVLEGLIAPPVAPTHLSRRTISAVRVDPDTYDALVSMVDTEIEVSALVTEIIGDYLERQTQSRLKQLVGAFK